jgi:hypothetical protein
LHSPLICTCSHPSPTCVKGALTLVYYCTLLQFLCLQDLGLVCCRNVNELGVKLQLLSWLSWVWEWQGFAEFLVLGGHWWGRDRPEPLRWGTIHATHMPMHMILK